MSYYDSEILSTIIKKLAIFFIDKSVNNNYKNLCQLVVDFILYFYQHKIKIWYSEALPHLYDLHIINENSIIDTEIDLENSATFQISICKLYCEYLFIQNEKEYCARLDYKFSEEACPICYSEIPFVMTEYCFHAFCEDCYNKIKAETFSIPPCPICRKPISGKMLPISRNYKEVIELVLESEKREAVL